MVDGGDLGRTAVKRNGEAIEKIGATCVGEVGALLWDPAVRSAGLAPGLRIHDLRHTCASLLIAHGAHPKAAQVHLGHSSISVTMDRYGHLFPSDMQPWRWLSMACTSSSRGLCSRR